jgi:hypothetical protein
MRFKIHNLLRQDIVFQKIKELDILKKLQKKIKIQVQDHIKIWNLLIIQYTDLLFQSAKKGNDLINIFIVELINQSN